MSTIEQYMSIFEQDNSKLAVTKIGFELMCLSAVVF